MTQINAALRIIPELKHWRVARSFLDRIVADCRGSYSPHRVAAALASIDAMYGGGLFRRKGFRWGRMIDHLVAEGPRADRKLGDAGIAGRSLEELSTGGLEVLVGVHARVAVFGNEREWSVGSKYLHFSYPRLFPIWDDVVVGYLGVGAAQCRNFGEFAQWYHAALCADWTSPIRSWQPSDGDCTTPVRTLDMVLWLTGLAARYRGRIRVNREVRNHFEVHPNDVDALLRA